MVKNLPVIWETWVQSLGWEDPLEKGKATHSSILAWRSPWGLKESPWGVPLVGQGGALHRPHPKVGVLEICEDVYGC